MTLDGAQTTGFPIRMGTRFLTDRGWTREQATGLLEALDLDGDQPKWKPEHLQKLHDWLSAHERPNTLTGRLEFIAYELRNSYDRVGMELDKAKTIQQAQEAVEPYVKLISEPVNPELKQ